MIGLEPSLGSDMVSKTKVLDWLLNRIQSKAHDENRAYSAELLSIFLQSSRDNKIQMGKSNGVEIILKVLSVSLYSKAYSFMNLMLTFYFWLLAIPPKGSSWSRRIWIYGKFIWYIVLGLEWNRNEKAVLGSRGSGFDGSDDQVIDLFFQEKNWFLKVVSAEINASQSPALSRCLTMPCLAIKGPPSATLS